MLEGLDKVDWDVLPRLWSRKQMAWTKDPRRIPRLLKNLVSDDHAVRISSFKQLEHEIIDDEIGAYPNEAMSETLPFLFEILASTEFHEKWLILEIFYSIVLEATWDRESQYLNEITEAIRERREIIHDLAYSDNVTTRFEAIDLYKLIKGDEDITPLLFDLIKRHNDRDELRVYTIRELIRHIKGVKSTRPKLYADAQTILLQEFDQISAPHLRIILALGIIDLLKQSSPIQAVVALTNLLKAPDSYLLDIAQIRERNPIPTYDEVLNAILSCGKTVA